MAMRGVAERALKEAAISQGLDDQKMTRFLENTEAFEQQLRAGWFFGKCIAEFGGGGR